MKKTELRHIIKEAIQEVNKEIQEGRLHRRRKNVALRKAIQEQNIKPNPPTQTNRTSRSRTGKGVGFRRQDPFAGLRGTTAQKAQQLKQEFEKRYPHLIALKDESLAAVRCGDDGGKTKVPLKGPKPPMNPDNPDIDDLIQFTLLLPPQARTVFDVIIGWYVDLPLGAQIPALSLVFGYIDEWVDGDGNVTGIDTDWSDGNDGFITQFIEGVADFFTMIVNGIDSLFSGGQDIEGAPEGDILDDEQIINPEWHDYLNFGEPLYDNDGNIIYHPMDNDLDGYNDVSGDLMDYGDDYGGIHPAFPPDGDTGGYFDYDDLINWDNPGDIDGDSEIFDQDGDGIIDEFDTDADGNGIEDWMQDYCDQNPDAPGCGGTDGGTT